MQPDDLAELAQDDGEARRQFSGRNADDAAGDSPQALSLRFDDTPASPVESGIDAENAKRRASHARIVPCEAAANRDLFAVQVRLVHLRAERDAGYLDSAWAGGAPRR